MSRDSTADHPPRGKSRTGSRCPVKSGGTSRPRPRPSTVDPSRRRPPNSLVSMLRGRSPPRARHRRRLTEAVVTGPEREPAPRTPRADRVSHTLRSLRSTKHVYHPNAFHRQRPAPAMRRILWGGRILSRIGSGDAKPSPCKHHARAVRRRLEEKVFSCRQCKHCRNCTDTLGLRLVRTLRCELPPLVFGTAVAIGR